MTLTKNALRVHLGLLLAEVLCIGAFIIEMRRALGGNTLSWAYVFEWPLFAVYAVYMWRKLLQNESTPVFHDDVDDVVSASLDSYNEYLAKVHELDSRDTEQHVDD